MNPYRDEYRLVLNKKDYVLRPTFEALAEMEGMTGIELVPLALKFQKAQVSLSTLKAVIMAGLKGAGQPVPDDLGALILKAGLANIILEIGQWLVSVFDGDKEEERPNDIEKKA